MQGTIRRNGVLEPMSPYGCWNTERLPVVAHSQDASVTWPDVFMKGKCPYDRSPHGNSRHGVDERCVGCLK